MKVLATLILVSCVVGFSAGLLSHKKLEYLKSSVISCGEMKGAAQADIDEILAYKPPSNRLGKCIESCAIEAGGIMKNNEVSPEGVESLTLTVYGDANRAKTAKEIATECIGVTDENPCEAGYKILQCLHDKAHARGISMDDD